MKMWRYTSLTLIILPVLDARADPTDMFLKLNVPLDQIIENENLLALKRKPIKSPVPGDYGHGFNSITNEILQNNCVKITSLVPRSGNTPKRSGQTVFHEVYSLEQVRNDTKTSASVSLFYKAFSGSAANNVVNGNYYSSYGRYVTAYEEMITEEYTGRGEGQDGNPTFTDGARVALIAGPEAFKAACGDYFVLGYKVGGVYSAVASVKANVDKDWKANETNVSVGFDKIFGASFDKQDSYKSMKSSSSFDAQNLSAGVIPKAVTIESLYKDYDEYADLVKAAPGLVTFIFGSYYSIIDKDHNKVPKESIVQQTKIEQLAKKRDQARQISNDLEVATDAIARGFNSYFSISGPPDDAKKEIDSYFLQIAQAVEDCRLAISTDNCINAIDKVPDVPMNKVKRQ